MSIVRNLIEYYGIADYLPEESVSFVQISIDDDVTPNVKNIFFKEVSKVYSNANVNDVKIVKTLRGKSLEGVNLTGTKVIVAGDVNYKIEYIADNEANSIHTVNHSIPYITSIVVPDNILEDTVINAEAFIEDINVSKINRKSIYLSSLLLVAID